MGAGCEPLAYGAALPVVQVSQGPGVSFLSSLGWMEERGREEGLGGPQSQDGESSIQATGNARGPCESPCAMGKREKRRTESEPATKLT